MIETAEEFVRLRASVVPADYERAAQGALPESVCREVIDRFPEMKVWVAHNKTVPLAILRSLAVESDPDVRAAVAMKRKLDAPLFALLAGDPAETVRHAIANNAKCPKSVLLTLLDDSAAMVREAAHRRLTQSEPRS